MRNKRYRCSTARNDALARLHRLRLGSKEASRKYIPPEVKKLAFQSAIFQASAALEDYLKGIFDHWVFELKRQSKSIHNIPSRARFSYFGREFKNAFSRYSHVGDEKAFAKKLQKKSAFFEFVVGENTVPAYLSGEFAYKDKKYPSPKNINALYTRIGCDNVFALLSREMKTDAEMKLQAFTDIRTALAHGTPPDITLADVRRNLDDVATIIRALDKINHKEFSKDFGGGVW